MSISRQMDKKSVVHIHNGIYYSAIKRNAFESVLMRCMKLKPIIQSEASQEKKHQYSVLIHMEFRKMVMKILYVKAAKETEM